MNDCYAAKNELRNFSYNPEPLTKKSDGSSQGEAYLQKTPKKYSNTLPMN